MAMSRQKRVERAQMKVLFSVPFFAPAVARLPVEFDARVQTAATNGQHIVWNPDWFDTLPDSVLPTVLCHEAAHCLLGHVWRPPPGVDWDTWNQACDHAVNLMLKEFSAEVMKNRLADPFPFPDPQDAYCANPAFANLAEERIYQMLAGQKPPNGNPDPNAPPGGGQGNQPGQGKQGNQPGQGGQGNKPGAGSMPSFGQMEKPAATADPTAQNKLANDWGNTLIQSVAAAKGRGDVPGCVSRFVDELLNPTIPWYELVRVWLREQASDDYSWSKPNPFFDDADFIMPSMDSDRIGAIVFGKDSSGSVTGFPEVCQHFVTEQQACLDDLRPAKLVDICCDTKIQSVKEYAPGEKISGEFPGGGGTSFVPVFEHCAEMPVQPKCLVYLTDLDGAFPDVEPPYPVLWVVYGGTKDNPPFGEVIRIEE